MRAVLYSEILNTNNNIKSIVTGTPDLETKDKPSAAFSRGSTGSGGGNDGERDVYGGVGGG